MLNGEWREAARRCIIEAGIDPDARYGGLEKSRPADAVIAVGELRRNYEAAQKSEKRLQDEIARLQAGRSRLRLTVRSIASGECIPNDIPPTDYHRHWNIAQRVSQAALDREGRIARREDEPEPVPKVED